MHLHEPIGINHLIKKLIEQSPHRSKLEEAIVVNAWNQVMPNPIRRRIEHIYVRQNKIFVKVASAPLRQELQSKKQQIIEELQSHIQDQLIIDIIFT